MMGSAITGEGLRTLRKNKLSKKKKNKTTIPVLITQFREEGEWSSFRLVLNAALTSGVMFCSKKVSDSDRPEYWEKHGTQIMPSPHRNMSPSESLQTEQSIA